MEINDILTLCKAGFTAEQIAQLTKPETKPEPKPEPKPETKPETKPEPTVDPVLEKLDKLTATLQAMAIHGSLQPPRPEGENVDSILASIINPPIKNKE